MNLNSRHFDRIRTKHAPKGARAPSSTPCDHPGCLESGEHRAPMGREREGQYFSFCLGHVREYNATYNYFNGMTDEAVARFQKDAIVGHRPTWNMGVNRASGEPTGPDDLHPDALGIFRAGARRGRPEARQPPRHSAATAKALEILGLDDHVDAAAVKSRYKALVKRLHPDANGGDRSNEDKLREIIRAYNFLKTIKLSPSPAPAGSGT